MPANSTHPAMVLKRSSMRFPDFLEPEADEFAPALKGESKLHQAASQHSRSVRAIAALGGAWNDASGWSSSAAATSPRVNQRASSSSAVSIRSSPLIASA